ncbi:MAG: TraM recognition domain-containing protein [Brockia lithotrophica]|nr:TraM recognition domain-containing protein [Brockia lithotrophica]
MIDWGGKDLMTHLLVVGPPRSGKTSGVLKPMIAQLLELKAKGVPLGLTVIEPKGDLAYFAAEIARRRGWNPVHIDPLPRDYRGYAVSEYESAAMNPLSQPESVAMESFVRVVHALMESGRQEAFFPLVQETVIRYVVRLAKRVYGDDVDVVKITELLRTEDALKKAKDALEKIVRENPEADAEHTVKNFEILNWFTNEYFHPNLKTEYRRYTMGVRVTLENLISHPAMRQVLSAKGKIDFDAHLENGGILAINTALGYLGKSGDALGIFALMSFQDAIFRRPGTEETRTPHFLIIDEAGRYITPDFERLLSLAPEYRVSVILAVQTIGQLEVASGKYSAQAMRRIILTNTRSRIVFGGIGAEDAEIFEREFGIEESERVSVSRKYASILPSQVMKQEVEKPRYSKTEIQELRSDTFLARMLKDRTLQPPVLGRVKYLPRNYLDTLGKGDVL